MLKLDSDLFARLNSDQWVGNQTPVIYGRGGLSVAKIKSIEDQLGFLMPDDFKYLLQNVRDPGDVLFDWENFRKQKYDEMIAWVLQGIEFDIDKNGLWLERWGKRPDNLQAAQDIARRDFASWPKLLPIYGHRFLAAEPCLSDNPVFSIMQTDIIYYGANLAHYLTQEFLENDRYAFHTVEQQPRRIPIWSDFTERWVGRSLDL